MLVTVYLAGQGGGNRSHGRRGLQSAPLVPYLKRESYFPSLCCRSVAEVAAPSKRGSSAFILAPLIETELSPPRGGGGYSAPISSG